MAISAQDVKKLRDATSLGFGDCKKALEATDGDFDAAVKWLREKGMAKSAKMADRVAREGLVAVAVSDDGKTGALIELNCETDFVAKNDSFKAFAQELADQALGLEDGALAEAAEEQRKAKVHEVGENLVIASNLRYQVDGDGLVASYIHPPGKIGVLVELAFADGAAASDALSEAAKGVCMHIAANNPRFLSRDDVDQATIDSEKDIYAKQLEGKPAEILDKIITGKINKFFSEICLLEQPFVMDTDRKVGKVVEDAAKDSGGKVSIKRFARLQISG